MLIEIVSHCYAKELPQYAAMLVHQASGLVLHKPKTCDVRLSVCVAEGDDVVASVVEWTKRMLSTAGIDWKVCYMSRSRIGRRCIGRNLLALETDADLVWFADVDQVFRDGVLDRLASTKWPDGASMIFPCDIKIHRNHATGDERTSAVDLQNPSLVDVDPSEFVVKHYGRAIGGVQIVKGDFAHEYGYLKETDWQKGVEKPFGSFADDVAYRKACLRRGPIVPVHLPWMYRLRHTRTTYQ